MMQIVLPVFMARNLTATGAEIKSNAQAGCGPGGGNKKGGLMGPPRAA